MCEAEISRMSKIRISQDNGTSVNLVHCRARNNLLISFRNIVVGFVFSIKYCAEVEVERIVSFVTEIDVLWIRFKRLLVPFRSHE